MFATLKSWRVSREGRSRRRVTAAPSVRSRRAAIEPLESRQLLTATPSPIGDLSTGPHSYIDQGVAVGEQLFFRLLQDPTSLLWRTDGTSAGTVPVVSSDAGSRFEYFDGMTRFDGDVYFSAEDDDGRYSLWRASADGTTATRIWSIAPVDTVEWISNLTVVGNALYFTSQRPNNSTDLWKTDGTADGTILLGNLPITAAQQFTDVGGTLFFATGHEDTEQPRLWKSDGTAEGTVVLAEQFRSDDDVAGPRQLTSFDGRLYFVAEDLQHGRELWRSDGSAAGTYMVIDIHPGQASGLAGGNDKNFIATENALYFSADDGDFGRELWTSDGTAAGTRRLTDIAPAAQSSKPTSITVTDEGIFFSAFATDVLGPDVYQRLWRSDGATAGAEQIANVDARELVYAGDTLFFTGFVVGDARRLWSSDGTPQGTGPVPTAAGLEPRHPGSLQFAGGRLYFIATDDTHGYELWVLSPSSGDLDGSFRVDRRDIAILAESFGVASGAAAGDGDLDGDGRVGLRDLIAMRNQFGGVAISSSASAVVARAANAARRVSPTAIDATIVRTPHESPLSAIRAARSSRGRVDAELVASESVPPLSHPGNDGQLRAMRRRTR